MLGAALQAMPRIPFTTLFLGHNEIGDGGAAMLGAALQAMPRIPFAELDLDYNQLTAVGVASLVPALRRPWGDGGLHGLWLGENSLGDAGVAALAKVLPSTLDLLLLDDTNCGDDGLFALVAVLPTLTRLTQLYCRNIPATARGWAALIAALPSLPALEHLVLESNTGLGPEGAAALAVTVPNCPRLQELHLYECELGGQARSRLEALNRPAPDPRGALLVNLDMYH